MQTFTNRFIESLKPAVGSRVTYRERDGFAIRVSSTGRKTDLRLRHGREETADGARDIPEVSLKEAREPCRGARSLRATGIDPGANKIEEGRRRRTAPTVQDIVLDYLESQDFLDLAATTKQDYRRSSKKTSPVREPKAAEITKRHQGGSFGEYQPVEGMMQRPEPTTTLQFRLTKKNLFPFNPCYRLRLTYKPTKRDVVLKRNEIALFWNWLDETPKITEPIKMVYRIMLATAQRKAEVCRARWTDVDWEDGI
ncbi:MAG: integrase family protein [bacterium]|nr:integrase family protein [bacterium]